MLRLVNKNFITDDNISYDLKRLVLEFLSFSEVACLSHESASETEDKTAQKVMIREFNRRKENDLRSLMFEISQPVNVKSVQNIIYCRHDHDFILIERLIIHISYLDPRGAAKLFSDFIYFTSTASISPDSNITSLFLRECPNVKIKNRGMWVASDMDDDYHCTFIVSLKTWTPLVSAALINNSDITRKIVAHQPKHIANIMSALNELEDISKKYAGFCYVSLTQVQSAKKAILLQLRQEHSSYYTLTIADKRLIEEHLMNEIQFIHCSKSLDTFFKQHGNRLYLNQHRHPWYDRARQRAFPRIKENIHQALKKQSSRVSADVDLPAVEKCNEALASHVSILKQALHQKKIDLLKQKKMFAFFLFYSNARTDEKIQALGQSLNEIETITDYSEFRLFAEGLLLNKKLTARRSIGISSSDTYSILKKFHDRCFLVAPGEMSLFKPQQA